MTEYEKENAFLQQRIAELEARLAAHAQNGKNGHAKPNGPVSANRSLDPRLMQAALSCIGDGVAICDNHGRLVFFNATAKMMFGDNESKLDPSEWSRHYGLYEVENGPMLEENELPLVRAMTGESVENVELFARSAARPEGIHVRCTARAIRTENNELLGAVAVCRDVTERKRAEAERLQRQTIEAEKRQSEKNATRMARLLQALLDHLDLVVWSIDGKGVFTYHDGRGSEPLGIPRGSLLGQNLFDLFPDTGAVRRALAGVTQHEMTTVGHIVWENWFVPVKDDESDAWHVIGLSLDVTETQRSRTEIEAKLALIERQQAVINDLETPVIQVWDRILTLPMVGVVDSRRAARVTDDLLRRVSQAQAYFAILDLTGVEVVDTATAGHLLNMISAVRLLGAEGIITGIRPNIAQTLISLGVNLSRVRTFATLRDGLAYSIESLGEQAVMTNPLVRRKNRN